MKLYNFKRLIRRYSVDFTLCQEQEGKYVSGKWEEGKSIKTPMRGAIVPMTERKIYDSGGTYTAQDRELYLTAPLDRPLSALKIIHDLNVYHVEEAKDFSDYADVAIYVLKWVSKND